MSAWAKPGVKCVVVDGRPVPGSIVTGHLPAEGTVVTISGFSRRLPFWGSGVAVIIAGYPNPHSVTGGEKGWRLERFRPLTAKTIEQDVQMILSLLEPAGADA